MWAVMNDHPQRLLHDLGDVRLPVQGRAGSRPSAGNVAAVTMDRRPQLLGIGSGVSASCEHLGCSFWSRPPIPHRAQKHR
jgi:hypothetical protein